MIGPGLSAQIFLESEERSTRPCDAGSWLRGARNGSALAQHVCPLEMSDTWSHLVTDISGVAVVLAAVGPMTAQSLNATVFQKSTNV